MRSLLPSRTLFNSRILVSIILTSVLCQPAPGQNPLPAFPGAEGYGSTTRGGRGGIVLFVTNLNNSGPGSLRAALEASGPRIVVFRTGGTVFLNSTVVIDNPYITIAGQTAPGGGFAVANEAIRIKTHDVIIRGMRLRPGDRTGFSHPLDIDGLHMLGGVSPVYNVIIDHCSFSWGIDKNIGAWTDSLSFGTSLQDVTIQWCISSEALFSPFHPKGPSHSMGGSMSSVDRATLHHNLFANNGARNPQFAKWTEGEGINNVVYNYESYGTEVADGSKVTLIGNYFKTGSAWTGNIRGINVSDPVPFWGSVSVYVDGNVGPGRPTDQGSEWNACSGDSLYRVFSPPVPLSGVDDDPAVDGYERVLGSAGAFPRDDVDLRAIYGTVHNTGHTIASQDDVGGWPTLPPGTPPTDTDNDGMPNDWETANGLNPNNPSDGNGDRNGDGYLNIEEYVNSLIVPQGTIPYAGGDQVLCGLTSTTLAGNAPFLGTGTWRVVTGSGTIVSPSDPASQVTNLGSGANSFEWRITYSGVTNRDTVIVTVDTPPVTANAGPDQALCNITQTSLSGNSPGSGTGAWRVIQGGGTITSPSSPTTTVTGLPYGTSKFEWSITAAGSCPPSLDTMAVTVSQLPTIADAGADKLVCNSTTTILNANRATVGTGLWRVLVGPAVLTDPGDHNTTVSGVQVGVNTFEWTISNGSCSPSRDTVIVTGALSPVSDFSYVINGLTVQFTSLAINATTYSWSFGDGTTSSQQNPVHSYSEIRSYRVTHTVTNACNQAKRSKRVSLSGAAGIMSLVPDSIDFGSVPSGTQVPATFLLTNVGNDTLDIAMVQTDGSGSVFSTDFPGEFSLPPDSSRGFTVSFSPDTSLSYDENLDIIGFDTSGIVHLSGTGLGGGMNPQMFLSAPVDFGETSVGGSALRTITLLNRDDDLLTIKETSLNQRAEGPFAIAGISVLKKSEEREIKRRNKERSLLRSPASSSTSWNKGDSLSITISFHPESEQADSAALVIRTSHGDRLVSVMGRGIPVAASRGEEETPSSTGPNEPLKFSLSQSYPNPFNPTAVIRYSLEKETRVMLRVYSIMGQEVATLVNDIQPAGIYQVEWGGRNDDGVPVASGIYIYRIIAGEFVRDHKMILTR